LARDAHVIAPEVARRIKFVGLDVDGVLTDGGIYLGSAGGGESEQRFEFKRYDIQDGLGIHFLRKAGIKVGIVTGRVSESVRLRAAELGVDDVSQDATAQKVAPFLEMLKRHSIDRADAAFLGDDFPDLPVLQMVGLPVSVGNAVSEVRAIAKLRLTKAGGFGAVREFTELLLKARGEWKSVSDAYVAERSLKTSKG
jgi:3-deoxy-D-manno-octulosonate 8-phosphate phosphatase (KDO 8-P phosphatase)